MARPDMLPETPREPHLERAAVSEAFLTGLLRLLPDPVFSVDEHGKVLSANDAGERLLGLAGPAVRDGPLWAILKPSALGAAAAPISVAAETMFETELLNRDGTRSHWEVRVTPLHTAPLRAWAVVARDLTERYEVQQQLEEQATELEAQTVEMEVQQEDLLARTESAERAQVAAEQARSEADAANAAKSQFLATMSHELRTPLNAIVGYAELLELELSGPLNDGQRGYLARLQSSGTHLLGLISDILDLAKIDAGGMDIRAERHAAATAIEGAVALAAPQAAHRNVTLDANIGSENVAYAGDADRVRQILANLLSNAVKFTDRGGHVSIDCGTTSDAAPDARLSGDGPWVQIRVSDTGIGIPPELQATVFEPFVQVEGGRTREVGGTGLGLAISRRLARLMGGDLTLDSALGRGSSFALWLPGMSTGEESPAERAARARRGSSQHRALGLRDLGLALRDELEEILESFVTRIRADAAFVEVRRLPQLELEDHALALLADLAQSLIFAEHTADIDGAEHEDSAAITRVVADRHGRQRHRLGLTEQQVVREYALLMDELTVRLQRHEAGAPDDVRLAVGIVRRLVIHSRMVSITAFREAAAASASGDVPSTRVGRTTP